MTQPNNPYSPPQEMSPPENPVQGSTPANRAAGEVKHTFDCVQFVRDAITLTQRDRELSPAGVPNAEGVCRVVLEMAVDYCGAEGKEQLQDWGITTSEDVGLIIRRLVEADLASFPNHESIDDFKGLFDLDQPPETWALQW